LEQLQNALRNASVDDERKRASLAAYSLQTAHATPKTNPTSVQGNSKKKDSEQAAPKTAAANQKDSSPKSTTDGNGDVTFKNGFKLSKKDAAEISKNQRAKIKNAPDKAAALEIYKKWRTRTQESSNSNNANSGNSSSPTVSATASPPAATTTSTSAVPNWQQRRFRVHFADNVKFNSFENPPVPVKPVEEPKTVGGGTNFFGSFSCQ
jgi:hypothetical protein